MSILPSSPREEDDTSTLVLEATNDEQKPAKFFSIGSILVPLRNRNFSLLFSGQLISTIGDMLYAVALPWFMLSGGGGAQALGIVLAAYGIPRAASVLLGGVLSDWLRPRRTMLLTDSVRIFLMAALAFLVIQGHPALWALCLVSALFGLFSGLFIPASWAVTPAVLSREELQAGNALSTSSLQLAGVAGSGIAGVVVALLQPGGTLALDALTFVVSAVTLLFMRDALAAKSASAAKSDENIGESAGSDEQPLTFWQFLRRSPLLQIFLGLTVFMNLGVGAAFEVALPALMHNQLHTDASGYGFVLAGFSVGAIIGAIAAGGLSKIPYRLLFSVACFFIMGLLVVLIPFMGSVGVGVLIMAVAGVLNGLSNVVIMSIIQGQLPAHLMGRVMSMFAFANYGLYPFSVAIAGVIVPRYGTVPIFLVTGLLIIVPSIVGCLQRSFWQRDEVQIM